MHLAQALPTSSGLWGRVSENSYDALLRSTEGVRRAQCKLLPGAAFDAQGVLRDVEALLRRRGLHARRAQLDLSGVEPTADDELLVERIVRAAVEADNTAADAGASAMSLLRFVEQGATTLRGAAL
tara:strand:- start:650 stop:1027 length:378 start_codon:yes stop_codon:yes gene_type:complete